MFSFFRKGHHGTKPSVPNDTRFNRPVEPPPAAKSVVKPEAKPAPVPPQAKAVTPPLPEPPGPPANNGIQVHEMEVQLAPEVEEAVMLYANGRTGDATAALNRFILDHPDSRDPQPWQLLFDLYELTGQRQPFEELAVDFAVRFERSPPTWRPRQQAGKDKAAPKHPLFAFGASLSPQDKARLEHFQKECAGADVVELDFGKTPVPDDDAYARLLLETLSHVAALGKEVHLTGGEGFVVRLNASRFGGQLTESAWLLLLMLLQLLGKQHEFDEVAVEYAIRFEISPPSYTPPTHIANSGEEPESGPQPSDHTFPLQGLLGAGSASVFDELRKFAAPLPEVEIDLSGVSRIDFAVVGMLMDCIMALTMAGKRLVFKGGNGMVNLLLQMVGISQFAAIQYEARK